MFPYSHLVAICSSGTSIPMLNIANQPVFLDITQVYLNTTDMDESQNCLRPWHPARFSSRNTVSNSEGLSNGYHRITYIVSVNISKWLSAMGGCIVQQGYFECLEWWNKYFWLTTTSLAQRRDMLHIVARLTCGAWICHVLLCIPSTRFFHYFGEGGFLELPFFFKSHPSL